MHRERVPESRGVLIRTPVTRLCRRGHLTGAVRLAGPEPSSCAAVADRARRQARTEKMSARLPPGRGLQGRVLPPAAREQTCAALTLRMVTGLTMTAIARAFLVREATKEKRITRAKARIKAARIVVAHDLNRCWCQDPAARAVAARPESGWTASLRPRSTRRQPARARRDGRASRTEAVLVARVPGGRAPPRPVRVGAVAGRDLYPRPAATRSTSVTC